MRRQSVRTFPHSLFTSMRLTVTWPEVASCLGIGRIWIMILRTPSCSFAPREGALAGMQCQPTARALGAHVRRRSVRTSSTDIFVDCASACEMAILIFSFVLSARPIEMTSFWM